MTWKLTLNHLSLWGGDPTCYLLKKVHRANCKSFSQCYRENVGKRMRALRYYLICKSYYHNVWVLVVRLGPPALTMFSPAESEMSVISTAHTMGHRSVNKGNRRSGCPFWHVDIEMSELSGDSLYLNIVIVWKFTQLCSWPLRHWGRRFWFPFSATHTDLRPQPVLWTGTAMSNDIDEAVTFLKPLHEQILRLFLNIRYRVISLITCTPKWTPPRVFETHPRMDIASVRWIFLETCTRHLKETI